MSKKSVFRLFFFVLFLCFNSSIVFGYCNTGVAVTATPSCNKPKQGDLCASGCTPSVKSSFPYYNHTLELDTHYNQYRWHWICSCAKEKPVNACENWTKSIPNCLPACNTGSYTPMAIDFKSPPHPVTTATYNQYYCKNGTITNFSRSGTTLTWKCTLTNDVSSAVNSTSVNCSRTVPPCVNCTSWTSCQSNGKQLCSIFTASNGGICMYGNPPLEKPCVINGACKTTHYGCSTGTSTNNNQGTNAWTWVCSGSNGGASSNCSQAFPTCIYSYGAWGTCNASTRTQTRTVTATNSPCSGNPITSQSCTPACTLSSCGVWSTCTNGTQTRTCSASNSPCTGTTSKTESRSCTLPVCSYNCGNWSGCSGNSHTEYQTCSATNSPCNGSSSYTNSRNCTPNCAYSYGLWSVCQANSTQTRTVTATNQPCNGTASYTQSQACTLPVCSYSYGTWGTCNASTRTQTRTATVINSPCTGSAITSQACTPDCDFDYSEWSTCTNGTQTRTFSKTNEPCSGEPTTTQTCISNAIVLSSFKNAFDLLPSDKTNAEQCLWCEWYERTMTINGVNEIGTGKAGSLGFSFYYEDDSNYRLKTVSILVNTTNSTTGGVEVTALRNSDPAANIYFGESSAPYIKADNTVSALTLDTLHSTIRIPYNGGTYYWFIKVTNTKGDSTGWIPATGKQITTPDHKWPTVAIRSATDIIAVGVKNQLCSTSSFDSDDPCYSTCWKGTGTPTASDLTNKNLWKCSVCYNTDGTPTLCQSKGETTFIWEDGHTTLFPKSKNQTWWQYPEENGREAMNPVIQPKSLLSRLELKIIGSDCPFGGSIRGGKINPMWREKTSF